MESSGECPRRHVRGVILGDVFRVVEANLDVARLWEVVVPAEDAAATVIAKKDKPARAYLLGALSAEILLRVLSKKTTGELWVSLKKRIGGVAARYAGLGWTLDNAEMVKKPLELVPDWLYAAITGMEQFCDGSTMRFEETIGRLKTFEERARRRMQVGGERTDKQLMLTAAQWEARLRQQGGDVHHDDNEETNTTSGSGGKRRGRSYNYGQRGHFKRDCTKPRKGAAAEQAVV
ncbi:retrotransposon protein [Hordeum vulgare]|nr:retrotransposon protein [Hordeum vulgare]